MEIVLRRAAETAEETLRVTQNRIFGVERAVHLSKFRRFLRRLLTKRRNMIKIECACGHFEFPGKIFTHRHNWNPAYPEEKLCHACYWKTIRAEMKRFDMPKTVGER